MMETTENQNITMFISDNGHIVYQYEFIRLVSKDKSKNDIEYYKQRVREYTNDLFEPSTNIEVVTLQNIIWNHAMKYDLNKTTSKLYISILHLKNKYDEIVGFKFKNDIVEYYKILTVYKNELLNIKIKSKRHIFNMNRDYPLYSYGFGITFFRLRNIYYELKDLYNTILGEVTSATISLNKYRKDVLTTTALCFKHNFSLPFDFKIEEASFINQIDKWLFF